MSFSKTTRYLYALCTVLLCLTVATSAGAQEIPTGKQKDTATPAEVYARILENPVFLALTPELQQEVIDEGDEVYQRCINKKSYATYHDCKCMAPHFIEARLADPETPQPLLMSRISKKCPNTAGIAGMAYNGCKNISISKDKPEGFCDCVANSVARQYENNPVARIEIYQIYNNRAFGECG